MSRWDDSDLDMPLNHHNPVVAVHSDGSFVSVWEMDSYLDSAGKEQQNTDIVFRLFKHK